MSDQNNITILAAEIVPPEKDSKRFASSATRRGNGAGWGGPAKGAGIKGGKRHADFEPGNQVAVKPAKG